MTDNERTEYTDARRAVRHLQSLGIAANPKSYDYPIVAPDLPKNIVPKGGVAPVIATDSAAYPDYCAQLFSNGAIAGGFPGFAYLSQLATRAEYRAMASTMSTELTRKWIEFVSTESDGNNQTGERIKSLTKEFERLGIRKVFETAAMQDCFFGRGQFFIDLGATDNSLPLVLSPVTISKGSLRRVVAVEPIWTTPVEYNALDPAASDFYKPTKWWMLGKPVHSTRLLTVVTRPLPDILKPAFNFAGMSLSQLAEPYVDNWLRTRQAVADLINNFSTTALRTAMDQVLQGADNGASLMHRAELFTLMRSNKGLMLLDKEREELVQQNVPLSGLHELQAQAQEQMSSVTRIPTIILTGISPSGLNASSEGEIRVFYDWIMAQLEAFWREPLEVIMKVAMLSLFGEIDEDISLRFVPLMQMTDEQAATIRNTNAQADAVYLDRGVVDNDEVRTRLAMDPDSGFFGIDLGKVMEPPESDDPPPPRRSFGGR